MAPKKRRTRKKKSKAPPPEEAPPEIDAQAIAALQNVEIADTSKPAGELSTYGLVYAFPEENVSPDALLTHEFVVDIDWDEMWSRLLTPAEHSPFTFSMLQKFRNSDIIVGTWQRDASNANLLTRTNNVSAPVPTINLPGFPSHSPVVDFQEMLTIDTDTKRFRSAIFSVGVPYGRDIRILSELTYTREALDDDSTTDQQTAPTADNDNDNDNDNQAAAASSDKKKKKKKKKKKSSSSSSNATGATITKVKPYVIRVDIRYGIHFDKKPFLVSSIIRYTASAALRRTWIDWEPAVRATALEFGYSAAKPPSEDE
jgi:hypothetical protein